MVEQLHHSRRPQTERRQKFCRPWPPLQHEHRWRLRLQVVRHHPPIVLQRLSRVDCLLRKTSWRCWSQRQRDAFKRDVIKRSSRLRERLDPRLTLLFAKSFGPSRARSCVSQLLDFRRVFPLRTSRAIQRRFQDHFGPWWMGVRGHGVAEKSRRTWYPDVGETSSRSFYIAGRVRRSARPLRSHLRTWTKSGYFTWR